MEKINIKPKVNIGDYITFNNPTKNSTIFKVLSTEQYPTLTIKIIFPKELVTELKEQGIFTIKTDSSLLKILGNPKELHSLRVLYG